MSNMSYCRFENTAADLRDVAENWDDELSASELRGKASILKSIRRILNTEDIEYDADGLEAIIARVRDEIEAAR